MERETTFPITESFQGKNNSYVMEIHNSGKGNNFIDMPEYSGVVDIVTGLYLDVYPYRDRNISKDRMKSSLSHPRTILMLARHQGIPIGFGIFPRFLIDGEPVLYSTRAFMPEHEGQGLGTHVLDRAILLHQEIVTGMHRSLRWGVLMTQNAFSVVTLRKSQQLGAIEKIFPFDKLYDDREDQDADRALHFMLRVHDIVLMSSMSIITATGVSKGELREVGPNEAQRPGSEYPEALEIFQKMVSPPVYPHYGFDMNLHGGDVVYVTFNLKRSNGAVIETPSARVA